MVTSRVIINSEGLGWQFSWGIFFFLIERQMANVMLDGFYLV